MYANAGQLQAQIKNSGEGDLFIAGAVEELKPVEQFVTAKQLLVKHIPCLLSGRAIPRSGRLLSVRNADRLYEPDGSAADAFLAFRST
ncbi:MAG: hypothetical protein II132_08140 [Desulfovibrio sp.]|nr:hypothetical protein [Desulfovibrio sp.]